MASEECIPGGIPAMRGGGLRVGPGGRFFVWLLGCLRRLTAPAAGAQELLRIEARLSLGPKRSLVLVECRGRRLLLAVSGDSVTPLMELNTSCGEPQAVTPRRRRAAQ